jgi:hypothetical protein
VTIERTGKKAGVEKPHRRYASPTTRYWRDMYFVKKFGRAW